MIHWLHINPLRKGFGICARSAQEIRKLEPTGIAVFRQADAGEWLREEDTLFTT